MKKINYLVLTLALLLVVAACGQGTSDNTQKENPQVGTDAEQTEEKDDESTEITDQTNEEPSEVINEVEVLDTINLYYSDVQLMDIYRVEIEAPLTKDEDGIKDALQLWMDGPKQEGLQGLVPAGVQVQSVTDVDGVAHVSFSSELLDANLGSTGEAALLTQIAMVVEQFDHNELFVLIDGEKATEFLGHVGLSETEPILIESSPEDFELYNE